VILIYWSENDVRISHAPYSVENYPIFGSDIFCAAAGGLRQRPAGPDQSLHEAEQAAAELLNPNAVLPR
jgi:hypothetical protein